MKKPLFLSAALVLAAAGCKPLDPRPTPSPGALCSTLGPAPSLPRAQAFSDTGAVPDLPASQFIVVGLCEATGAYIATGVDVRAESFTFLLKGAAASRSAVFSKFHAAGVPVTVYTRRVKLNAGGEAIFDPCATTAAASAEDPADGGSSPGISDDPRDPPVPPGIASLAWCTANAQTAVTQ